MRFTIETSSLNQATQRPENAPEHHWSWDPTEARTGAIDARPPVEFAPSERGSRQPAAPA